MRNKAQVRVCFATLLLLTAVGPVLNAMRRPNLATAFSDNQKKYNYALIYGTIWDSSDHPVGGVPVKIRRASEKKPKWELVSDRSGEFAQRVPAGKQDYIIEADIKMPKGRSKPQTTVHVENDERVDVSLHLNQQELPRK